MTDQERALPEKYRPLGAWAYFGYMILFSIPLVGFICLLIFSLGDGNVNRRNFARSYFCVIALVIIVTIVMTVLGFSLSSLSDFMPVR